MGTGLLLLPLVWTRLPGSRKATALIAVAVTAAVALWMVPPQIWQRLSGTVAALETGSLTYRVELWQGGLEVFRDHSLLGVGAGAYGTAILPIMDLPYVAHNTFLSVLVELGVVGALIFAALLGLLVYCAIRMPYLAASLWIMLLLTWTVGVSTLTWEYRKPTWFLFGLLTAHAALSWRSVSRRAA
jgi:O-antigen ligase